MKGFAPYSSFPMFGTYSVKSIVLLSEMQDVVHGIGATSVSKNDLFDTSMESLLLWISENLCDQLQQKL